MSPWRRPARMTTIADIQAIAQKRRDPMRHKAAKSEIASAAPLIVEAWRCIGCGRIEAPQPCIGVCEDRKVRLVDAADHEAALALLREAEERAAALEAWAISAASVSIPARTLAPTAKAGWLSPLMPGTYEPCGCSGTGVPKRNTSTS